MRNVASNVEIFLLFFQWSLLNITNILDDNLILKKNLSLVTSIFWKEILIFNMSYSS